MPARDVVTANLADVKFCGYKVFMELFMFIEYSIPKKQHVNKFSQ